MNRVKLLGYEIDTYDFESAVDAAFELMKQDKVSQIVTINPEMFDCANVDNEFSCILKTAEMVIPDGIGVKLGLKLMGEDISRIAGIDFAKKLLELSAQNGMPVAIIGAKHEIIEKTKANLEKEFPDLNIVYSHDGYFQDDKTVYEELKQAKPRLVLVALGSPKQEKFINYARNILPCGLMIGVGGSFDVWSGEIERAPVIFQRLGIEWLYRTVKQPERFKRIFPAIPLFILGVLKSKIKDNKLC